MTIEQAIRCNCCNQHHPAPPGDRAVRAAPAVEQIVRCDCCNQPVAYARTAWLARQKVSDAGGVTGLPGGCDCCGECVTAGRQLGWWRSQTAEVPS